MSNRQDRIKFLQSQVDEHYKSSARYWPHIIKQEALSLIGEGISVLKLSKSTGIRPALLYSWLKPGKKLLSQQSTKSTPQVPTSFSSADSASPLPPSVSLSPQVPKVQVLDLEDFPRKDLPIFLVEMGPFSFSLRRRY